MKNTANLSGKLNSKVSFHLITNYSRKNKLHETTPYFIDKEGKIDSLNKFYHVKKPDFISFFINDDLLSIVEVLDTRTRVSFLDYKAKEVSQQFLTINADKVFSHNNFCLIIEKQYDNIDQINFSFVRNKDSLNKIEVLAQNKTQRVFFRDLVGFNDFLSPIAKSELINEEIYVNKGSIKPIQGFWNNNKLIFLSKDKNNNNTYNIFELDLNGNLTERHLNLKSLSYIQKKAAFLKDNYIFVYFINNQEGRLVIYDFKTLEQVKSIPYSKLNFDTYNEVVVNGKKVSKDEFKINKFLNSFNSLIIGTTYAAQLYIGVNKDQGDENYIVEIGHVDKNIYRNLNAQNFWWQYDSFHTNSFFANGGSLGTVGALSLGMSIIAEAFAEEKRKGNYFRVNFNESLDFSTQDFTPKHTYFDTNKYVDFYGEKIKLKNYFFMDFKEKVRFINYNKKEKKHEFFNAFRFK